MQSASNKPETTARTPTDGKPFYCDHCGAGFAEFLACEEMECEIESGAAAVVRMNCVSDEEVANG